MRFGFFIFITIFFFSTSSTFAQRALRLINKGKVDQAEKMSLDLLKDHNYKRPPDPLDPPRLKHISKFIWANHAMGVLSRLKGDFAAAERYLKTADSAYVEFKIAIGTRGGASFGDKFIKRTIIGSAKRSRHDKRHYARRNEVASILIRLGEMKAAKDILDSTFRAMKITFGEKASVAKTSYATFGEYYTEQSRFDSARYYFEKYALALRSDPNYYDLSLKGISDAYAGIAKSYIGSNDPREAIVAGKKASKYANHRFVRSTDGKNYSGKINTANLVAEAYRIDGQYKQALQWNDKAYELFQKQIKFVTPEKLPVLATRGQIFWALEDTVSANSCFSEMMEIFFTYTQNNFSYLSEAERAYFYRNNKHFLELTKGYYHYLYFQKGFKEKYILRRMYEIHLNNKGVLLSSSSKLLNHIYSRNDPDLIRQYEELRALKEKKNKELAVGRTDAIASLDQELNSREKRLRNALLMETEQYLLTSDIIATIPESTDLIDVLRCSTYSLDPVNGKPVLNLTDKTNYLYFILNAKREPILISNPLSGTELETRFYQAYLNFAKLDIRDKRVFDAYFAPVQEYLTSEKIIVSPDGIYNLINPEIIFDGKTHLINRFRFQSIVSAKDLKTFRAARPELKDMTLIGWPDYSTHLRLYQKSPADLPGTERELQEIRKIVDASLSHQSFIREEANEIILKQLASTSVLHFATHGFFESSETKDPMYTSGLVLAVTDSVQNREDGYLTAYEASNLDLKNTFLVVLSACETGQGAFEEGEGVWGLQRAFQVAGVRYVMMSLFKVDDQITVSLMREFYKNLTDGNGVLDAFRKAQLVVRENHQRPVDWGAFVIKGI